MPRPLTPPLDVSDVHIARHDVVFRGYGRVHEFEVRHHRHEGGWSGTVRREIYDSGDAVVVLPYDPVRDTVVLVEQFRAAPLVNHGRPWLIECIAGRIDKDATPEEIARLEAREEADCELTALTPIGRMYASPGIFSEVVHYFCGRTDTAGLGGVHGLDSEHEDIRVHVVSFAEAMAALADGRIQVAPAFIALQWLALNRERLRKDWG